MEELVFKAESINKDLDKLIKENSDLKKSLLWASQYIFSPVYHYKQNKIYCDQYDNMIKLLGK